MGLFGTKVRHPLDGLAPHDLREGTQIALVDVEPGFVDYVRSAKPRQPRIGHAAPIALVLQGDDVVAYYDDKRVGRMDPRCVDWYRSEFATLQRSKQFGRTSVFIKPDGAKSPHAVSLNWGVGAFDGGIL